LQTDKNPAQSGQVISKQALVGSQAETPGMGLGVDSFDKRTYHTMAAC
jgi:hypothetical protein